MRLAPVSLALTVACQGAPRGPDDDGGPFVRIVGPVSPEVEATGERTRGAIAWAWVVDGQVGGAVQWVPFEPRVLAYALDVGVPPPAVVDGPAPDGLTGLPALLWGVPILVEPSSDAPLVASVDPVGLIEWAAGHRGREGLVALHPPDGGQVVATTPDYLLAAMEATGDTRLSADPAWVQAGPWCAFDQVVAGLTLYDAEPSACGSWNPLASPGERTEFQGVAMEPW